MIAGSRLLALASIFCGLAAAGCSSKMPVHELRFTATGIAPGDPVVFMLNRYEGLDPKAGADESVRVAAEQDLLDCIHQALAERQLRLELLPPARLREAVFSGRKFEEALKDPLEVLRALTAEGVGGAPAISRVRYVVLLDLIVSESSVKVHSVPGPAIGFEASRERRVNLKATVLDLSNRRIAGELFTSSRGARGGGIVFLYIVPIPIVALARPDHTACHELAQALVSFLVQ